MDLLNNSSDEDEAVELTVLRDEEMLRRIGCDLSVRAELNLLLSGVTICDLERAETWKSFQTNLVRSREQRVRHTRRRQRVHS